MQAALKDEQHEDDLDSTVVKAVLDALAQFSDRQVGDPDQELEDAPSELMRVFEVGSRACYQQAGQMAIEVEVVQPTIMEKELMYQVVVTQRTGNSPAKRWISARYIEPAADPDTWAYRLWDPVSEQYVDEESGGVS